MQLSDETELGGRVESGIRYGYLASRVMILGHQNLKLVCMENLWYHHNPLWGFPKPLFTSPFSLPSPSFPFPFPKQAPLRLYFSPSLLPFPLRTMDSDQALELSLGVGKRCGGYIPPSISNFLNHLSMIKDISERLAELNDYVSKLEQEMRKLDALKRNPQHCMLLLKDGKVYR